MMMMMMMMMIIIIIIISFMQGTYTYIPEKNYVPREYSVAAILFLLFMVLISLVPVLNVLYFYISNFRSTCAEPSMAVFCSSFISCFPGMLLTYFLNDFELLLLLLYDMDVSCHKPILPGTSLEPAVIPTAQASRFTLHYFPYYV